MPELIWKGKDAVKKYHSQVPLRNLEKKYHYGDESENMIIHGDNLEALKALIPRYEGKFKCVYIDPPYNTGKENWVYNDNMNSPATKKWLNQVVGKEAEDFNRHDKWLCMMYPRLQLLKKLLADDGAIFISIDDNEQAELKLLCDEIFGRGNFIAQVIWERAFSPVNLKKHFSVSHDYIAIYAKNLDLLICNGLTRSETANERYSNPDNDARGVWTSGDFSVGPRIDKNVYTITTPSGKKVSPPSGRCWRVTKERFEELALDNRVWFGEDGNNTPRLKKFLSEVKQSITPMSIWKHTEVGHSQDATKDLKNIFDGEAVFDYPKSVNLLKRCFELYSSSSSLILDSFAGSGTTAHAVLNLNKADGGNRHFVLIEMEDYAESVTAERVRRVISGYGKGDKAVAGTGGGFGYYELGERYFLDDGNLNENLPLENLREYIFYSATRTETKKQIPDFTNKNTANNNKYYLGTHNNTDYYFFYKKGKETCLDREFIGTITQRAELYVIFADRCILSDEFMKTHNIRFKKIPRGIAKL